MKKVLIIGPFPNPITGVSLANKVVLDNLINKNNFSVKFINTSYNKFDENLGTFSLSKLLFYLKLNLFAGKIFKANIVYITPGQTFFGVIKYSLFIFLTKLLNKELIIHVHGNYIGTEYSLLKGFKKKIYKSLLSKTSKGIVLSESLTGNMSPFIKDKQIYILYNFVEDYLFVDEKVIDEKLKNTIPKIFFLSNLMEEKGIFQLLEAFKILEEEGFQYKAKIAGHIDLKHKTVTDKYFKLLKYTEYCGVVSGDEKKDLLLWGNIFALPTYYTMEGQPISILEAMATANLILTTNHAGIPDIFTNGVNGYYVDKNNAISIAEKIKVIVKQEEKNNKIRKGNYFHAIKNYKVDNFINNIVNIFEA